ELDLDQVNAASAALRSRPRDADGRVELAMADSLWVSPSFQLSPEFVRRVQRAYDARVEPLDPGDPGALARVNRWVSDQTRGMIPRIVDRLPNLAALLVLDAIYFNGRWRQAFDPTRTRDRPFHRPGGNDAPVPMLAQAGRYPYLAERLFEAVALPYGDGSISLDIFLPRPGVAIGSLLPALDAERFEGWARALSPREGDVVLPKLALGQTWDLRGALERLGLSDAFTPGRADFRGISATRGLAIGDVKHRATIQVDEAGTVAAAATSVGMVFTAMLPMPRRFHVVADRPFVFVIREQPSGVALFLGVVVDPGEA
ncbi:MAG: serpin family protein, partial [Chloroflexota bacterium]